jgi:hypothetical protein
MRQFIYIQVHISSTERRELIVKKILIATFAMLAVLVLTVQPVSAGVEPSPFQPQENEVLNMVNHLDVSLVQLDHVLALRPGPAKGIIKHRAEVVNDIRVEFGDLYQELENYISELPGQERRGRPAVDVLGNGIETVEEIILIVDEYLRDPDVYPGKILMTALLGLRGMAAQTLPLIINAWELVGGVEPSPF